MVTRLAPTNVRLKIDSHHEQVKGITKSRETHELLVFEDQSLSLHKSTGSATNFARLLAGSVICALTLACTPVGGVGSGGSVSSWHYCHLLGSKIALLGCLRRVSTCSVVLFGNNLGDHDRTSIDSRGYVIQDTYSLMLIPFKTKRKEYQEREITPRAT